MSRLILLLALYFCIYGIAQLYVLIKLRRAFYLHGIAYGFLVVLLAFLMLAPVQARILEAHGYLIWAVISAWCGYIWMGYLFIAICLSLPLDGYHILIRFGQRITHSDWAHLMLSRRQCVGFAALAALGLMAYGALEAYQIKIEKVTLSTTKLPAGAKPVRVVQISDVHLGLMYYPGRLTPVLSALESLQPDIIVSTGDLVDGRMISEAALAEKLKAVPAALGKYAVTGNHEFYSGLSHAQIFITKAGFSLLRNRAVNVNEYITIAGVDDPAGNSNAAIAGHDLFPNDGHRFNLLLKHRPTAGSDMRGRFDLQLSGHTHKGQIFPFGLLIGIQYSLGQGHHQISDNPARNLYISSGTGTWGPPIRLLAPPEITVFDIVPESSAKE